MTGWDFVSEQYPKHEFCQAGSYIFNQQSDMFVKGVAVDECHYENQNGGSTKVAQLLISVLLRAFDFS